MSVNSKPCSVGTTGSIQVLPRIPASRSSLGVGLQYNCKSLVMHNAKRNANEIYYLIHKIVSESDIFQ